jgi:cytidylate kinase
MPVITISRQFGAAGVPVGRQLAERLNLEFLDRALVRQVALRSGVPEDELETYDERLPGFLQRLGSALAATSIEDAMPAVPFSEQVPPMSTHDRLVAITRTLIEEAAQRGNVVIVGRGAAFVLGKRPGTMHVQLHADIDARVRFIMSRVEEVPPGEQGKTPLDEHAALELCRSVDSERADYIRRLYRADWLDTRNYDISLDTGRLGVERTVNVLEHLAREWPAGR